MCWYVGPLTWAPALTVDGIVVAAAKLAGDAALAACPLPGGTEGAAPQPPLLALHHNPGVTGGLLQGLEGWYRDLRVSAGVGALLQGLEG